MKITTISAVMDYAEILNNIHEATNISSHEITIHGIESVDDLEAIAKQENGNFWKPDSFIAPYHWAAVKLGKIDFILTNKLN